MASPRRKNWKLQIKPDAYRIGETVTPERAAKLGGIAERPLSYADKGVIVSRRQEARIECTLDSYRYRRMISDEQHQVAMLFRWAYLTAARTIKVSETGRAWMGLRAPSGADKAPHGTPALRFARSSPTLCSGIGLTRSNRRGT
jgi:hypothetical protein